MRRRDRLFHDMPQRANLIAFPRSADGRETASILEPPVPPLPTLWCLQQIAHASDYYSAGT